MLQQLQVLNFQNQTKRSIDFDPNVTVLTGPSDSGKSAIIRALRWACTNTPSGDAFIQDGKKDVGVRLKIDDRMIERRKGSKGNEYRIDKRIFKSFGTNIPDPIANFLNLSEVTWQGQHDSPFWLAETAGQVGRELNAVVNLESIDAALLGINRLTTKEKAAQEAAQVRLKGVSERLEAMGWVEQAKGDMGELEASHTLWDGMKATYGRLYSLYADAFREQLRAAWLGNAADDWEGVLEAGGEADDLMVEEKTLRSIIIEVGRLEAIKAPDMTELDAALDEWSDLSTEEKTLRGIIREVERLEAIKAPDVLELDDALDDWYAWKDHVEVLSVLVVLIKQAKREAQQLKMKHTDQQAELLEEMEGRCPLCGAEIGDLK